MTRLYNALSDVLGREIMKIAKNAVVTVRYKLTDAQNNLIDGDDEPIVYLHGGYENVFVDIEQALEGQEKGYSVQIQIEPEDAFGEYEADLIRLEPKEEFPEELEVGMQFEGESEGEHEGDEPLIFVVTDIADGMVVLDGNHPLAGIALRFELEVLDVRAATKEEVEQEYPNFGDDEAVDGGHFRSFPIQ